MSSPVRLLLLSGTGGAGTTTLCAATHAALLDEGLRSVVIDATAHVPTDPRVRRWAGVTLGRLAADIGADPVHPETWGSLATASQLSTLLRISDEMRSGAVDAVVVDCGPIGSARQLVGLPSTLTRILDSALTPRVAMHRPAAPESSDDAAASTTLFEDLEVLRAELADLATMLVDPAASMRIVTTPDEYGVDRALRAVALFSMLGLSVDAVIANRCARKSDGWPKDVVLDQDRQVARLESHACGAWVWRSTSRIRAVPKDRSAMGPFGSTLHLTQATTSVRAHDEEYALDVPLVGAAAEEAVVGRLDDDLVVEFDGAYRWLPLPPVLRRCRASHATRTDAGLRVSFVPDVSLWRRDPSGSAA